MIPLLHTFEHRPVFPSACAPDSCSAFQIKMASLLYETTATGTRQANGRGHYPFSADSGWDWFSCPCLAKRSSNTVVLLFQLDGCFSQFLTPKHGLDKRLGGELWVSIQAPSIPESKTTQITLGGKGRENLYETSWIWDILVSQSKRAIKHTSIWRQLQRVFILILNTRTTGFSTCFVLHLLKCLMI